MHAPTYTTHIFKLTAGLHTLRIPDFALLTLSPTLYCTHTISHIIDILGSSGWRLVLYRIHRATPIVSCHMRTMSQVFAGYSTYKTLRPVRPDGGLLHQPLVGRGDTGFGAAALYPDEACGAIGPWLCRMALAMALSSRLFQLCHCRIAWSDGRGGTLNGPERSLLVIQRQSWHAAGPRVQTSTLR